MSISKDIFHFIINAIVRKLKFVDHASGKKQVDHIEIVHFLNNINFILRKQIEYHQQATDVC